MSDEPPGYILRMPREELERQLFGRRAFHVGISRDWSRGTRVLFVRKAGGADAFVGSGTIDRFVGTGEMEEEEKKLCLENNWHGRIVFERIVRFYPAVPLQDTPAAGRNPLTLHGSSMPGAQVAQIEGLAPSRIIS